ncbi:signal transduction histidine kinase [Oxalobacteraceae bacterium GrIS 2.11]
MRQNNSPATNPILILDGGDAMSEFSDNAATTLRRMMIVAIISIGVGGCYAFFSGHDERILLSSLLSLGIVSFCYFDLRHNRIERALSVFCWGFWLFACCYSFLIAGIRTPILVLIPSAIMIIAWSQGKNYMLLMVLLTTVFFVGFVLAENNHWLPAPIMRTAMSMFITYMTVILSASVMALVIADNFKRLIENSRQLTVDLRRRLDQLHLSEDAMRNLNNQLEQRVLDRTALYDQTNQVLQNTVTKLELAQKELLQSEKLASLGSMVAGISHELNTPVGNALMLTTSLENLFEQIIERINAGQLKRSELDELLQTGIEMSGLATKSTKRAVELVTSFKQLAVDQTSELRRTFNLHDVIDDNLSTLLPTIKQQHKTISIDNKVATRFQCDSFPGPLGQIIVSLTQNAILHGFEGRECGNIIIRAVDQGETIVLTVSDDGVGMAPNILVHVFDPFFTTKLGKGGSGIGLSISHRIATSVLGGNLTVSSSPRAGAQFTLTLPKSAPFKF